MVLAYVEHRLKTNYSNSSRTFDTGGDRRQRTTCVLSDAVSVPQAHDGSLICIVHSSRSAHQPLPISWSPLLSWTLAGGRFRRSAEWEFPLRMCGCTCEQRNNSVETRCALHLSLFLTNCIITTDYCFLS